MKLNKAQLCASLDLLDEPLKGLFSGVKKQFDDMLATMTPTDQVPAALDMNGQLQSLWSCLYSVNSLVTFLNQSLNERSCWRRPAR